MNLHAQPFARRSRGPWALVVVAALLAALPVFAAAPPPPKSTVPAVPGPPGLFDLDEFHTDPVRMALAVFGGSTTPTGPLSAAAVLCGGEHPRVQAWKLEGVLTNRVTRIQCGVGTVFLAGFRGDAPGLSAVAQLATLRYGDDVQCWALRDTNRFRPWPEGWLNAFTDGKGIRVGSVEAEVYSKVLSLANYTSAAAFKKAARSDITYTHMSNDPETYRGEVVHIEGKLKRINRFPAPYQAAEAGVNDLYEAWVFSEYLGSNPYCVIFTEWPANLPRSLLGKETIPGTYRVAMNGYFLKKFRYQARDGKKTERDAPLLMGHTLIVLGNESAAVSEGSPWLNNLVYGIVGVFGLVLSSVIGLTWWFRRTDNRVRRRLLAAHSPEFVLPTPDAFPVAAPVGPPLRRIGNQGMPPRITLPAGPAERHIEPPSSGEGGKRGSPDKPPEEGAGA